MNQASLASAVHAAISSNPMRLKGEAIAARMGVSTSALYSWGDPASKKPIPLERLVQLVLITGDNRPISALTEACGGSFVHNSSDTSSDCHTELMQTVQIFAAILRDAGSALADNIITPQELHNLQRKGPAAMLAIARLIGAFERGETSCPCQRCRKERVHGSH